MYQKHDHPFSEDRIREFLHYSLGVSMDDPRVPTFLAGLEVLVQFYDEGKAKMGEEIAIQNPMGYNGLIN